jgi:hypothetical protein
MIRATSRRAVAAILTALLLSALPTVSALATSPSELDAARAATARFNSLHQATRAGYGLLPEGTPLHECIMALDGSGGMGFHFVNGALLDTTVDATAPEVLVYAPDKEGRLKLVALEYVVFQAPWFEAGNIGTPTLFGQAFHAVGEPNRYEIPAFFALHVWLWDENAAGMFEDFNPNVSCG